MKYSIQCKYSITDNLYKFIIKNTQDNSYQYVWLVQHIDKPLFLQTNSDIIIKTEIIDDQMKYSIAKSKNKCNENIVKTSTTPIMIFDADIEDIQIVYDYDHLPTEKQLVVGKVINQFLQTAGGGFFDTSEQYKILEHNILNIIDSNISAFISQPNKEKESSVKEEIKNIDAKTDNEPKSKKHTKRSNKTDKKKGKK